MRQYKENPLEKWLLILQNICDENNLNFSNESDLINRITLGMTASKFRKHHDIAKSELIRDYMTTEQLNCIVSLQRANTVYIEDGLDFQERKKKLTDLFDRKHKQKLIDEIHLLEP